MKRFGLPGVALAVAAVALGALLGPGTGVSQTGSAQERVTVAASATVDVEPDIARVFLGIHTSAATAEQAADQLSVDTRRVLDALTDAGFSDEQLTIRSVSVFRERNRDGDVTGYAGNSAVVVETEDLDAIGDVIDIGTGAGADSVRGVDFDLKENSGAVREALRKAMTIAQGKAEALATTAGRNLGRALVIREGGTRDPGPVSAAPQALVAGAPGGGTGGGGASGFPIIPPDITVRTRIEVTFALQ